MVTRDPLLFLTPTGAQPNNNNIITDRPAAQHYNYDMLTIRLDTKHADYNDYSQNDPENN